MIRIFLRITVSKHKEKVGQMRNKTAHSRHLKLRAKNCDVLIFKSTFAEFCYLRLCYVRGKIRGVKTRKKTGMILGKK